MYKIETKGKMIAILREQIGAKQKHIKGKYKREYITSIENGTKVPDSTLTYIYNIIAAIAKDKGIKLVITLEELLMSDEEKIKKACRQIIADIKTYKMKSNTKDNLDLLVNDINNFIKEYEVNNMYQCEIYSNIAELYSNECIEYEAEIYIIKTIELSAKIDCYNYALELIHSLTKALRKCNKEKRICLLGMYALLIYERVPDKEKEVFINIFFNVAKANKNVGNINESLKFVRLIEDNFILTSDIRLELEIIKGCCNVELSDYHPAENIFLNVLNEAIDIEDRNTASLAYINLSEVNLKIGNKIKAKDYFKKAYDINVDERYESTVKYLCLNLCVELDEQDLVNKLYHDTIKLLVKDKDEKSLYTILDKIVDYFIFKNEVHSLNILVNLVYNYIMEGEIKNRNVSETLFLIANYMMDIDIKKAKNYSDICTKCITRFKQNAN